jgi:hypothetical protein
MKRPNRIPAQLSETLHHRLNMYALAASAAGVSVLALAQAEAKIVYTPDSRSLSAPHWFFRGDYLRIDLNHDGITDFALWWYSNNESGSFQVYPGVPGKHHNGGKIVDLKSCWETKGHRTSCFEMAAPLASGNKIGPTALWDGGGMWRCSSYGTGGGDFCGGPWGKRGQNAFLGVEFKIKGKTHYGWEHVSFANSSGGNRIAYSLGYAYETIPKKPIRAGDTGKGNLRTLSKGAAGITAWREFNTSEVKK